MKIAIIFILLLLCPALASALDVELLWTASTNPRLSHYTVYQTERIGFRSGPSLLLGKVSKDTLAYSVTIQDGKSLQWFVIACDKSGNHLQRTNAASYHPRFSFGQFRLIRRLSGGN